MCYVAIIQARCGSSRLPGKVLMDLCGKPVLQRVIERVQNSKYVDEVMVVTSIDKQNLPILRLCADLGVRVFAGSEDDVLDRYYQLAKLVKPDYIVRITADCPCYDWTLLDQAIEAMRPETDYLSDFGETLPDGLDLEIIKFESLKVSWERAELTSEREHVTQYVRKHPKLFSLQDFSCPAGNMGHLRWTLDEEEDYALIQKIYNRFDGQGDFLIRNILDYLKDEPELAVINKKYARNEGLAKSLREDRIADRF